MMQAFVFRETGLDQRFAVHRAKQSPLVYFKDEPTPLEVYDDEETFAAETQARWGEAHHATDLRGEAKVQVEAEEEARGDDLRRVVAAPPLPQGVHHLL